ncbi:hypothetical protein L596_025650 [Steinernema carpocapsae]|uniref:Uncharacterized protein n=1 Tax=Steinernema carpocapsae TaxID=34508 RepID=A0A4U5M8D5_STECR|nr:hypothetical protein L596_025650 [Steinernema carpocapsae]
MFGGNQPQNSQMPGMGPGMPPGGSGMPQQGQFMPSISMAGGMPPNIKLEAPPSVGPPMSTGPAPVSVAPPKMKLSPPPHPYYAYDKIEELSVEMQTTIGKELSQEIAFRCLTFLNFLKSSDRRVMTGNEPQAIIEYCIQCFATLAKIQIALEKNPKVSKKPWSLEEWLDNLKEGSEPVVKRADVVEKEAKYDSNRKKLIEMMTELKMMDWIGAVCDPHNAPTPEKP